MGAQLKAAARLVLVLLHAIGGWFTIVFVFPRLGAAQRNARVEAWAARMLRLMGVALRVEGTPPAQGPVLLVANHISWLDILVMHASRHCRFVAKSEVRHWPLIGRLATAGGTLYIERESRRDAMRVVHHMAESLTRGEIVAVFPEGTTGDGINVLPFHANLVQAAISTDAPVQPVGLKFVDTRTGERSQGPSYLGEETLAESLWRTLASDAITAVIHYGEPRRAEGRARRAWAAQLQHEVERLRA